MRLVLDGLEKTRRFLSGQRRNPNVSNLELQPVTCDRMRGERAFSQLQRINSFTSCLISAISVSHLFPLLHHFGPSTTHRSTFLQLIFFRFTPLHSASPSFTKICHVQHSMHTPSLIPRLVSLSARQNLLEDLSASQTFGLSPLLREWLDKPYTTSTPSNAFSLPLSACLLTGPG